MSRPMVWKWPGELDGSGLLSFTWAEPSSVGNSAVTARVDELSWLRIERDAIELVIKYVLPSGASPETLVVAADRRWKLSSDEAEPSGTETEPFAAGQQSIRVVVPAADEERRVATLRFRLRNVLPPGQLRLPPIELTSLPVASRRLAVSVDPAWECEAAGGAALAGGTSATEDFTTAWGPTDAGAPQLVLNTAECRAGWFLAVRPRTLESKSDERLTITAAQDHLNLQYEANVQPQGVHRFHWSLSVPEALTVDNVSADANGQTVALDFVRAAPDRVNVFFATAVESPFHLVLDGTLPLADSGECPLPRVTSVDRPAARQTVQIFRDKDVAVKLRNLKLNGPLTQVAIESPDKPMRQLVGICVLDRTTSDDSQLLIEPVPAEADKTPAKIETSLAAARPRPDDASPPSVRLAETIMEVSPAGSWYSITRFVIAPHGMTQCVLQLPEAQRLVATRLDGQAALTQQLDSQTWRVQLGPPKLPQTLEVVTRGVSQLDSAARFVELARPVLRNSDSQIPVEVSLWSICRPTSASSPRAAGAALVSPLEAAVLRLDRLASIAESATPAAMEASREDSANWSIPHADELLAAKCAVQTLNTQGSSTSLAPSLVPTEDDAASLAIARSAAWIAQVGELAGTSKASELESAKAASDPSEPSLPDAARDCTTASFVSESGDDRLTVEFVPVGLTAGGTRAVLLACVVSVAGLATWLADKRMRKSQENHQSTTA